MSFKCNSGKRVTGSRFIQQDFTLLKVRFLNSFRFAFYATNMFLFRSQNIKIQNINGTSRRLAENEMPGSQEVNSASSGCTKSKYMS